MRKTDRQPEPKQVRAAEAFVRWTLIGLALWLAIVVCAAIHRIDHGRDTAPVTDAQESQ